MSVARLPRGKCPSCICVDATSMRRWAYGFFQLQLLQARILNKDRPIDTDDREPDQ